MDFYTIGMREIERGPRKGEFEIYPDFIVGRSKDLMVRGKSFYAIWDEEAGLWSTDEYDVQRLVDEDLYRYAQKIKAETGVAPHIKYLRSFSSKGWNQFRNFLQNISDNSRILDANLTFANTEVKKGDYVSRRLPYPLAPGDCSAWNELVGTLYNVEERAKLEWLIGAIVSGDSKKIQKFGVLYGPPASGKGTVINIIQKLFVGYCTTFDAKALGSSNSSFATEVFGKNPLVAIQHDGDLSKIDDNARLNSIISHEEMTMNEKFKPSYTSKVNALLFIGTNLPVKISDAKSGIIRRLIDIHPTGVRIPTNHYNTLMAQIDFELGAIAHHCLEVYQSMGKNYYNGYRPLEMMLQTDVFFNFIEAHFDIFKEQDGVTLKQAYALYKEFCDDTGIDRKLPQYKVREELRNYFDEFKERYTLEDGTQVRSYYQGFNASKFKTPKSESVTFSLVLEETESLLDELLAEEPAQGWVVDKYGDKIPAQKWSRVRTKLKSIDTHELHFVKLPTQHIVIDFDLKDVNGDKSLERNLEAASVWPATYAELSQGGNGVHLHYFYDGDVTELAAIFSEGIEVKTLLGDASLRRRLTKCNNIPVATLSSGLPLKEKKSMQADHTIKSEKALRDLIERNLRKEIHGATKPSIDFIKKILDDAYDSGLDYDVTNLRGRLVAFANNSSNQPLKSLEIVMKMKFQGKNVDAFGETQFKNLPEEHPALFKPGYTDPTATRLTFFDVEVYPNLLVVCWMYEDDDNVVRMINPSSQEIEGLFKMKLVGFFNRNYDNHILYARYLGYNNQQLFELSQKLIAGVPGAKFGEAYNLSYTDIYDYSSKKQSLKKFEIELGMHHMELDIPWDQPVDPSLWPKVTDYCANDVKATAGTHKARYQDFVARQILAELSGLTVNDTTARHTAKIIFGNDRQPSKSFVYTDLSKEFPGYEFDPMKTTGKSSYRGEDPGEGGYVYAEPGIYHNVALLDVASMHPTSIIQLNLFGDEYTPRFKDLLDARLAIKHKDFESARKMLDGKLAPYLTDESNAGALSDALKIVINIVYGLTSAKFDNPFRDIRNKDNIVAKRGALFMIKLKKFVQEQGFTVAHIKTDSIKIPEATPEIIDAVMMFGAEYGYTFEHEATYSKMALVNDAVYIAKYGWAAKEKLIGTWDATGAQFQHPYVYKTLFTEEPIEFNDVCETKQVSKGVMYLDFDAESTPMFMAGKMHHVGRTGRFVPVKENCGGGILYRVLDGKLFAVTGTKGYFWKEAEQLQFDGEEIAMREQVDFSYFERLVDEAVKTIGKYGDFIEFVS